METQTETSPSTRPDAEELDTTALALIESTALTLVERANQLVVIDQASFERADSLLDDFASQEKRINALFDPIREARFERYQRIQKLQKQRIDELAPGKVALKVKSKAWLDEQARLKREAEERARQERERIEREQREAAEAERVRLQKIADEERLEAALRAEASGDHDVAEAIIEQPPAPIFVPMAEPVFFPPAEVALPKADGRRYGKKWKCRVKDIKTACRQIADGAVSERLVEWKASELSNLAKSMGGVRTIPGFDFYEE
jgi:hypothetical protein